MLQPVASQVSMESLLSTLPGWLLAGTSIGTVAGAAWTVLTYTRSQRREREQRDAELKQRQGEHRWRLAQAAKTLLDEMLSDAKAQAALDMLDSWTRSYDVGPGKPVVITVSDWLDALQSAPDAASDLIGTFVRDSFDALFYYFAMLEHYVSNEFVLFADVRFPMRYYVAILAEDKTIHEQYLRHFDQTHTLAFLERFSEWTTPSGKVLQSRVRPLT